MSTYTYRLVEGRFENVAGDIYNPEDLPSDAPVGTYYRCYKNGKQFYKRTSEGWVESEDCPKRWKQLFLYTERPYIPSRAYYMKDGEKCYYSDEPRSEKVSKYGNHELILKKEVYFADNGGIIRDDFVRTLWNDSMITGRGLPDDMSEEVREFFKNYQKENEYERGYDHTYATLSELCQLCNAEIKNLKLLLKEKQNEEKYDSINKKLDIILNYISNPKAVVEAVKEEIKNIEKDEDTEDEEEYSDNGYDFFDEDDLEYKIQECIDRIEALDIEIGKISLYSDLYEIYLNENIRVIYFLS